MQHGSPPSGPPHHGQTQRVQPFQRKLLRKFLTRTQRQGGLGPLVKPQGGRTAGLGMGAPQHFIHCHIPAGRTGTVIKETPHVLG